MRNHQRRAPFHQALQCDLHRAFALRIQRAGCFIKQQNRCVFQNGARNRDPLLLAVANLLVALAGAGAWHADLNLKNIYIAGSGADLTAYLLDVDRVTFPGRGEISSRNFKRLARSARKWRVRWGLDFDEASLARLAALAGENR